MAFGIDWLAEAEYGGYYQAVAQGIYAKHGLDVTIRQGGPQVNQAQLLLGGRLDFTIAGNSFLALNFAKRGAAVCGGGGGVPEGSVRDHRASGRG